MYSRVPRGKMSEISYMSRFTTSRSRLPPPLEQGRGTDRGHGEVAMTWSHDAPRFRGDGEDGVSSQVRAAALATPPGGEPMTVIWPPLLNRVGKALVTRVTNVFVGSLVTELMAMGCNTVTTVFLIWTRRVKACLDPEPPAGPGRPSS